MMSGAVAYKETPVMDAEALDLDESLLHHIRAATSFVESQPGSRGPLRPTSAVRVRRAGGDPVVVVLVDMATHRRSRQAEVAARFNLTAREAEVALLLADRLSCREIAERLEVSFHTARSHTERILTKLGVRSKNEVRLRLGVSE